MSGAVSQARYAEHLSSVVGCGNRFAGTPGEALCREQLHQQLGDLGLGDVALEEFPYLCYGPAETACRHAGSGEELPCTGLLAAASADAEGDAIFVGEGEEDDFARSERSGVDFVGRIVVAAAGDVAACARRVAARGAAGFVQLSAAPGEYITHGLTPGADKPPPRGTSDPPWAGWLLAIPAVVVRADAGRRLLSDMTAGTVRLAISHHVRYSERTSANVLGTLRGDVAEAGIVVVGAHYDNQASGVGAWDNASGVAALLAIAESLAADPSPRRRDIRFISFGAEEHGMWGSFHHVDSHADELGSVAAMVNLDTVGAAMSGSRLMCASPALTDLAADAAASEGWRADRTVDIASMGWFDHGPFVEAGVPACCLLQDIPKHPYYHTAADDVAHLNLELACIAANANRAIVARLAAG